ncbi:hypothetical protein ACRE_083390 [Hapsidospora chrysogenum ATCC 11550]|uniref:Clr5 domain-containing protein n=1 Tax=Hapsidospora chrysogenum (strain ATCC 11550 / CBS 779.69 / DSM 880 / IAM 14645 / JCM 23072 / IMI 49137) TaxID=857340 RepID=A0A086SV40_HAPC1|nr:hypothetical protein ACRE_083390 [Hapsidospora chrysogenum ATCC 11550]
MVKPWKEFRQEITRLYIQEGRTLAEVRAMMRERHGFQASIRSYRQHFERWDLQKYNCKKRQQRRQQQRYAGGDRGSSMLPSPPRTPLLASSRHHADDTRGPLVVAATAGHRLPHAPSPHYFFDEPMSPLDGFERTPTSQQFDPARYAQRRLSAEGEGYGQLALPPGAAWSPAVESPGSSASGPFSPLFGQASFAAPPVTLAESHHHLALSGFDIGS